MTKCPLVLGGLALALVLIAPSGSFGAEAPVSDPPDERSKVPLSAGAAPEIEKETLASFLAPCAERLSALEERGYEARSLVVTLPDPVDTRYHREFDLLLTAVRRALEHPDLGFLQDRHCLPWSASADGAGGPAFHRSLPGAILFRKDPPAERAVSDRREDGEVLTLLLVGEVPAWGVQTEALSVALTYAVEGLGDRPPASKVSILGPTFSGSTRSLAVALDAWREGAFPGTELEIVSGSATSPANRGIFEEVLQEGFSYRSAVTPDDHLQDCLWNHFVPERLGLATRIGERNRGQEGDGTGHDNGAVAILVESSLYGRGFDQEGFHVLPFPMHISQLRSEHEKQRRRRTADGATGREILEGSDLPILELELADDHATLDQLPVFDREGTSRTQDLVLANILTTISRNRIEVAAIAATNTVDKLFLAEILRSYAPDVRLVTFEGDLLLAHPEFTPATLGMLVVSSNPLRVPDPLASDRGGMGLQFASDTAQGVYEATRELLRQPNSGEPAPREVWLSTVGRSSLIPLERVVFEEGETRSCRELAKEDRTAATASGSGGTRVPPPRGWALVLSLTSLLIFSTLYEILRRSRRQERFLGIDWRQFAPRSGRGQAPHATARLVHGLIVLIPMATAVPYLLLSGPYLRYLATGAELTTAAALLVPTSWDEALFLLILTCPLALALTTATLLSGLGSRTWLELRTLRSAARRGASAKTDGGDPSRKRRISVSEVAATVTPLLLATAGIVFACLVILGGYGFFQSPSAWLTLLLQRSISLGSGVSPLLPILLLLTVVVGWVLSSLWRARTLDELPERCRDASGGAEGEEDEALAPGELTARLRDSIAQVRRAVDPATFWVRAYPLLWCLLLVTPALYLSFFYAGRRGPLLRGLEHWLFDWSVSALFLVAVAFLLGSALSLRCGWRALRRWLQHVRTIRFNPLDPEGPDGEGDALWLQRLQEVSSPGRRDCQELRLRREEALEALRAQVEAGDADADADPLGGLRRRLADALAEAPGPTRHVRAWLAVLEWTDRRSRPEAGRDAGPDTEAGAALEGGEPALVTRARELFVWQTGYFTREALTQLGQLMAFLMAGLLVLFLAISTYPFEPHRVLTLYVGTLILLGTGLTATILFQMEKSDLLRQLSAGDEEGGKLHRYRGLVGRLALFVGLPLFSVLASQIPGLRSLLLQWLGPVLKSLL